MESELLSFFKTLSERHWIENDLSDMLWSLLKVSEEFRKIFFKLINSKSKNKDLSYIFSNNCLNIEREFYEKEISGRPDLKFEFANGRTLILEVKVGDKDYHKNKYSKLKNTDVSVLTINHVDKTDLGNGWINFTWKELHDCIRNTHNELISGFAMFIKGVFSMRDIKEVKSFEIKDLLYINWMVEAALLEIENERTYIIQMDSRPKSFSDEGSGYYFLVSLNESQHLFPWVGINYNTHYPFGLMFWLNGFHQMHHILCKMLLDHGLRNSIFPEDEYIIESRGKQVVIMLRNWERDFLSVENKDEQIRYIKNFILQCLSKFQNLSCSLDVTSKEA